MGEAGYVVKEAPVGTHCLLHRDRADCADSERHGCEGHTERVQGEAGGG